MFSPRYFLALALATQLLCLPARAQTPLPTPSGSDPPSAPECTICPLQVPCGLEVTKWRLEVDAAAPDWTNKAAPDYGRVPMEVTYELHNPSPRSEETRLMLVTEDSEPSVVYKDTPQTLDKLTIPAPAKAGWSRPKLKIAVFNLVMLGDERGELRCRFRQPLGYTQTYGSQMVFFAPKRHYWAKLGKGTCKAVVPSALQIGLEPAPGDDPGAPPETVMYPTVSVPWPRVAPPADVDIPVDPDAPEMRFDFQQTALPPLQEMLYLGVPAAALGSLLTLLLPLPRRRFACAAGMLLAALFTLGINRVLVSRVGLPDFNFRFDSTTWKRVFEGCAWVAAPLVAAAAVFFAWPLFRKMDPEGSGEGART